MNPRRLFELDFHAVLRMWKSKGKRLLVVMDVNKYIIIGMFMQRLMSNSMLDLAEETPLTGTMRLPTDKREGPR